MPCNCKECGCESKAVKVTDAMGREIFWEDISRPND